jgi:RNAse (barnase) inhibitor barstar
MGDDRSPIGIVNKEAADRRKQRRKGHIQIIEEDRKRLREEINRLTAELDKARRYIERLATASVKELTKAKAENAALRELLEAVVEEVLPHGPTMSTPNAVGAPVPLEPSPAEMVGEIINRLTAELAEERMDTERLDWCQAMAESDIDLWIRTSDDDPSWAVDLGGGTIVESADIRAAIDAAMKGGVMGEDRSPIGIVNKEAADRRRQRRKGHIQIIEEDRKRLREENECLIAELAEAREDSRRLDLLQKWGNVSFSWPVGDLRKSIDRADLNLAAIDAGEGE